MKFAHTYKTVLRENDFPNEWIDSAISYGQLKKCIKKLKTELENLGLQPHTLEELVREAHPSFNPLQLSDEGEHTSRFQYNFSGT